MGSRSKDNRAGYIVHQGYALGKPEMLPARLRLFQAMNSLFTSTPW